MAPSTTRRRLLTTVPIIALGAGCLSRYSPDPTEIHVRNSSPSPHEVEIEITNLKNNSSYRESASLAEGEVAYFERKPAYSKVGFDVYVDEELKNSQEYRQKRECPAREFSVVIEYGAEVFLSEATCV